MDERPIQAEPTSQPGTVSAPPLVSSTSMPALPSLAGLPTTAPEAPGNAETLPPPASGGPAVMPAAERYVIRGEIARGGMGAVLHGLDTLMDRDLAIKVLGEGLAGKAENERRFFHEARVHGRLQHPGIVPIYEMGQLPEHGPFFTMKLVQGHTLAELLRQRTSPAQDLPRFLQIFEQVCQTLAYAHASGVLHRDLKPPNIMVGAFGEVQVMDWGLAKELCHPDVTTGDSPGNAGTTGKPPVVRRDAAPADQTNAGAVMGTPAYMAPEQARGEMDRIDQRADVFGLGAILCEILTGQPPFCGATLDALRQAARGSLEDAWARLDVCGADPELVRLARECLAPERDARPRDAGAMARAMTAYLAGVQERLHAAEVERAAAQARAAEARAKAAAERRARRLTLGLAAALLLLAGLAGGGWLWLQQRKSTTTAAVNVAFLKAENLHEQAGGDLARLTRAVAAYKEAQALAEGGYCDDDLRSQVQHALAGVEGQERQARLEAERQAKHQQMLARLTEIRSQVAIEDLTAGGGGDGRAARAYERTFADWGLDIDRLAPEEAAARLRAYPPEVMHALAGGLDHWVQCGVSAYRGQLARNAAAADGSNLIALLGARAQPGLLAELPRWRHRLMVARQVDPDALRNRLRDALLRYDMAQFKRVAQEADAATLPTDTIQNLTPILWVIGERDMTLNLLRKAAASRPDDFWIHFYLGYYATQARNREEALVHATAAAALQPRNVLALQNLGMCLEMNNKDAQGLDLFQQALRLDPGAAGVHFGIGLLFLKKGDRKGALPHLREAVRLEPNERPVFHQVLADTLRADKDLAGALAAYQAAVRVAPRDAASQRGIGLVLQEQGKTALALSAFQKAMQLEPTPDTGLLIARALVARGSVEEAVAYLTNPAASRADQTAQTYTACLVLQDRTGEYRACCAALLRRYGLTHDDGEAYWIARCLTLAPDAGTDPAEAVRLADRAFKAQPTAAWYVHALALAHVRAGQADQAITLVLDRLRKAPVWQPSLQWLVLVLAYQRLGKEDQAQFWLNQARRVPIAPVGHYVQDGVLYQCLLREAEAAQKKPGRAR